MTYPMPAEAVSTWLKVPEVQHGVCVEVAQRRHGGSDVAVVAVEVVLDHDLPVLARMAQQLDSSGGGHVRARRKQVVGRDEHGPRIRRNPLGDDAVGIDRGIAQLDAAPVQHAPQPRIPGRLDGNRHRCVAEGREHEREPVAGTRRDDHVSGVDAHGAQQLQVLGDGRAQLDEALAIALRRGLCRRPSPRLAPGWVVDRGARTPVWSEVDRRGPAGLGRCRSADARAGAQRLVRARIRVDSGRAAGGADEVSLGGKLVVGGDDGAARDAELRRQRTRRGHGLACCEAAGRHELAHRGCELGGERGRGCAVEHDRDHAAQSTQLV